MCDLIGYRYDSIHEFQIAFRTTFDVVGFVERFFNQRFIDKTISNFFSDIAQYSPFVSPFRAPASFGYDRLVHVVYLMVYAMIAMLEKSMSN